MNDHRLALAIAATAALTACGVLPTSSDAPDDSAVGRTAPLDPTHAFLTTAADGAARAIMDPTTGSVTEVTAGARYFAASGRECRHYSQLARPAPAEDRLACRDANGQWQSGPSLVNPRVPNG